MTSHGFAVVRRYCPSGLVPPNRPPNTGDGAVPAVGAGAAGAGANIGAGFFAADFFFDVFLLAAFFIPFFLRAGAARFAFLDFFAFDFFRFFAIIASQWVQPNFHLQPHGLFAVGSPLAGPRRRQARQLAQRLRHRPPARPVEQLDRMDDRDGGAG